MKKMLKKMAAALIVLCMICVCLPMMAFADASKTYTVIFSAGELGTFSNAADKVEITGLHYGQTITAPVVANVEAMYVEDTYKCVTAYESTVASTSAISVTGDAVYVMQYQAELNAKTLTVRYVDENGTEVAPSQITRVNANTTRSFTDVQPTGYTFSYAEVNGVRQTGSAVSATVTADTVVVYHYTTNTTVLTNTVTETTTEITTVGVTTTAGAGAAGAGGAGTTITDNTTPQGAASSTAASSGTASSSEAAASSSVTIADSTTPQGAAPAQSGLSSTNLIVLIGAVCAGILLIVILIALRKRSHKAE